MRKLKIAQLAPPWLAIPPKKYGGVELIIYHLVEGLIKKGHEVTLFACGNSKTSAKLESVFKEPLYWEGFPWQEPYGPLFHTVSCFEKAGDFDIIHNHFHFWGICLEHLTNTKVLTTYHSSFEKIIKEKTIKYNILKKYRNTPIVPISNSQKRIKGLKLNFTKTVYNGIDVDKFSFQEEPGRYLAWMGRITPKKGVLEAIKIAKKAKMPLKIAAKIDKNSERDIRFYKEEIEPLIDGKQIQYLGEIGGYEEKSGFLKNALALINPIKWKEPFGLVMAEAMACGTPVIAFDRGSVKEVVKDKKTGFVVKNVDQAAKAVKKIGSINRKDCRLRVKRKFNKEKMVDEHEKLYYKVLSENA